MPLNGDQHISVPDNLRQAVQFLKYSENSGISKDCKWDFLHQQLIQSRLEQHLGPEFISTRPAPGGNRVSYLEGWRAIQLANDIFGFNGWSSEIKEINIDFCDQVGNAYCVGVSATVRVTLKDGTFHEDVGFGHIENSRSKALAFDKCRKEATTDALKRTLRKFGNALGNSLYNKSFLNQTKNLKKRQFTVDRSNLIHEADFSGGIAQLNQQKRAAMASTEPLHQEHSSITLANGTREVLQDSSAVSSVLKPENQAMLLKNESQKADTVSQSIRIFQNGQSLQGQINAATFRPIEKDERPLLGPDNQYGDGVEDLDEDVVNKNGKIYPPDELQFSDDDDSEFDDFFNENLVSMTESIYSADVGKLIKKKDSTGNLGDQSSSVTRPQPKLADSEKPHENKKVQNKKNTCSNSQGIIRDSKNPSLLMSCMPLSPTRTNAQIEKNKHSSADDNVVAAPETIPKNVYFHRLTIDQDLIKEGTENAPTYNPQLYPRKGRHTVDDCSIPVSTDILSKTASNQPTKSAPEHTNSTASSSPSTNTGISANSPTVTSSAQKVLVTPNHITNGVAATPASHVQVKKLSNTPKSASPTTFTGSPARQIGAPKPTVLPRNGTLNNALYLTEDNEEDDHVGEGWPITKKQKTIG